MDRGVSVSGAVQCRTRCRVQACLDVNVCYSLRWLRLVNLMEMDGQASSGIETPRTVGAFVMLGLLMLQKYCKEKTEEANR